MISEIELMLSSNKDMLASMLSRVDKDDSKAIDDLTKLTLLNAQYSAALGMSLPRLEAMSEDRVLDFVLSMKAEVESFTNDLVRIHDKFSA